MFSLLCLFVMDLCSFFFFYILFISDMLFFFVFFNNYFFSYSLSDLFYIFLFSSTRIYLFYILCVCLLVLLLISRKFIYVCMCFKLKHPVFIAFGDCFFCSAASRLNHTNKLSPKCKPAHPRKQAIEMKRQRNRNLCTLLHGQRVG